MGEGIILNFEVTVHALSEKCGVASANARALRQNLDVMRHDKVATNGTIKVGT